MAEEKEDNWHDLNLNNSILDEDNGVEEIIEDAEIEEVTAEEIRNFEKTYDQQKSENFDEVLQLTQYDGGAGLATNTPVYAEYTDIDLPAVQQKHQNTAKSFVDKITKFILDFKDVELSTEHKAYLKAAAKLQIDNLQDLLELVDINKQMLQNIIRRVNATQAEDYAIIAAYNNLSNQHLKLLKELQNTYKAIPTVLKKMRADVITNQELGEPDTDEVVTENYGTTQFNNSKQLLRQILDKDDANAESGGSKAPSC